MRNKDTSSWEELLSECADSWELGDIYADGSRQLLEDGSVIGTIAMHISQHEEVVVSAPSSVAEVVRLRREVAEFRDQMTKSAEQYEAMYDRERDLDHLLAAEYDRQIAYVLNRILEGDTDE